MALNEKAVKWLESRALSVETALKHGVQSSEMRGTDWLEFPYIMRGEQVNTKYRNMAEKQFSQDADGQKCVWNFDCLRDATLADQPLIITEGEMDSLSLFQAGYSRVVSVPDGAPANRIEDFDSKKYSYLDEMLKLLDGCKEIIIAADNDNPGANLLHDLSLRLGKTRCKFVRYPRGCKDLNNVLVKYAERGVVECINRAEWVHVDGVYAMNDLPPVPQSEPHKTGIPFLDRHYNVRLGDFCVITGIPSHGKSTFTNHLVVSLVRQYGWNACFASFEQHPTIDHKRNLRRIYIGHSNRWTAEEMQKADAWINDKFRFMVPSDDDDVTLQWVLERASLAVVRHNCRVVVIDPWNEMDHMRPSDMSLTEYTGFAIKKLRQFARRHMIHLIVVAHPVKLPKKSDGSFDLPTLYDISDSAHWYNKSDIGIVVHRKSKDESVIRIAKSRYHDIIGEPGEVDVYLAKDAGEYRLAAPHE